MTPPVEAFDADAVKLGKRAARNSGRDLLLSPFVSVEAPPSPPSFVSQAKAVALWPILLNNQLGDCAIAAPLHQEQLWSGAHAHDRTVTDAMALNGYEAVGGYRPGDPSSDQGCVYGDVMDYWRKTGLGGFKIAGYARAAHDNPVEVRQAIWLFGGAQGGFGLPLSAQGEVGKVWKVHRGASGQPGSWGGHAVYLVDYDHDHVLCVTWGRLQLMTWAFLRTYADEVFAALSLDWVDTVTKRSPQGFDWQALNTDLAQFH